MSASNFKRSLALVLAHEGGYVNHPKDPGGATNFGVTQRVYDAHRKYHGQKTQTVKLITDIEVADIYAKNYWKLCRADSLPLGLDYAVFDFSVNSGVSRAVRYLQRLVGVEDDGVLGVISMAAIEAASRADEEALITQYCANRLAFVTSLSTFSVFGKGWTRRIVGYTEGFQQSDKGVLDYAICMAREDNIVLMPTIEPELTGKAISSANDSFPTLTNVYSPEGLKQIVNQNNALAQIINHG